MSLTQRPADHQARVKIGRHHQVQEACTSTDEANRKNPPTRDLRLARETDAALGWASLLGMVMFHRNTDTALAPRLDPGLLARPRPDASRRARSGLSIQA
jgi:hypothetical protein